MPNRIYSCTRMIFLSELQFTTEARPVTLTLTLNMCSQAKVDKLFEWCDTDNSKSLDVEELEHYFKHVNKVFGEDGNTEMC